MYGLGINVTGDGRPKDDSETAIELSKTSGLMADEDSKINMLQYYSNVVSAILTVPFNQAQCGQDTICGKGSCFSPCWKEPLKYSA